MNEQTRLPRFGLYYDWTKYELPRGSFGAETWCISYRSLDTLNLDSLNLMVRLLESKTVK